MRIITQNFVLAFSILSLFLSPPPPSFFFFFFFFAMIYVCMCCLLQLKKEKKEKSIRIGNHYKASFSGPVSSVVGLLTSCPLSVLWTRGRGVVWAGPS